MKINNQRQRPFPTNSFLINFNNPAIITKTKVFISAHPSTIFPVAEPNN